MKRIDGTFTSRTKWAVTVQLHSLFLSSQVFKKMPTHFPYFFKCVMEACLTGEELGLSLREQTVLLLFLDHCFNSLVCFNTFSKWFNCIQYSGFVKWLLFFRCPLDVSVVLRCNSDHQAVITCNETFESCNDPMSFWPCESLYFKSSVCFCPILMGVFLVSGGRSNPWTGAAAHFSAHVDVPPAGEHCSTTLMILTEIAVCSRSSFIHWPLHFVNIFCCKCTNNSSI